MSAPQFKPLSNNLTAVKQSVDSSSNEAKAYMKYRDLLQLVETQKFDELSQQLQNLRESSWPEEQARRLLSTRVSLLNGNSDVSLESLDSKSPEHPWIECENNFVQGLIHFHRGEFLEGSIKFKNAAYGYFNNNLQDRYFLSLFNAYVGQVNSGHFASNQERLSDVQTLERLMFPHKDQKNIKSTLALVLREKSILLYDEKKYRASSVYAQQAADMFRECGTLGDWHLSLLLASLSAFKTNQRETSLLYFEQVVPPFEGRVAFAYDVMKYFLGFSEKPNIQSYSTLSPLWLDILEGETSSHQNIFDFELDLSIGVIKNLKSNIETKLPTKGLESRLLRLLVSSANSRRTRAFLIESLWPESAQSEQLDNRLHQLLFRIKSKYSIVISFDGVAYQLGSRIQVK
jgi:hypothetical protein